MATAERRYTNRCAGSHDRGETRMTIKRCQARLRYDGRRGLSRRPGAPSHRSGHAGPPRGFAYACPTLRRQAATPGALTASQQRGHQTYCFIQATVTATSPTPSTSTRKQPLACRPTVRLHDRAQADEGAGGRPRPPLDFFMAGEDQAGASPDGWPRSRRRYRPSASRARRCRCGPLRAARSSPSQSGRCRPPERRRRRTRPRRSQSTTPMVGEIHGDGRSTSSIDAVQAATADPTSPRM